MERSKRGAVLTVFAILFAILAISDLAKPFRLEGPTTGFVFFGTRQAGLANDILGPLFGIFLLVYAAGIWRMRYFALPMAHAYAAYVIINLIVFSTRNANAPDQPGIVFSLVYVVIAVGVSLGSAILLTRNKAQLT